MISWVVMVVEDQGTDWIRMAVVPPITGLSEREHEREQFEVEESA
jgi:hypothetical protein